MTATWSCPSTSSCPTTGNCTGCPLRRVEIEVLTASTGRLIRAGAAALDVDDATWGEDTAVVVLSQPAVREALASRELVAQLRGRHREVPWGGSKVSTVCACGASWPCDDALLLGVAS